MSSKIVEALMVARGVAKRAPAGELAERDLALIESALAEARAAPASEPFGWVMTEGPIQLFSRTKPDSLVNRWVPVWDAPPPVAKAAEPVAWAVWWQGKRKIGGLFVTRTAAQESADATHCRIRPLVWGDK